MTRFLPRWRKATWTLAIFTALMGVWTVPGGGVGITLIIVWLIGFIALGLVWLLSRSKNTFVIHGPQGQQWAVSKREAQRRLHQGWSYQPRLQAAVAPTLEPAA